MTTSQYKGNVLEAAVLAIEQMILHTSPNVREKSYLIESKKIINVAGVHHEVDLFVTFDLGPGYDAVFIFECKNWKEAVGKNEIIVFAAKIDAARAQRGFFIAKSFTADAEAQAKKEPRMELVVVAEHDPSTTILPFKYQSTNNAAKDVHINFRKYEDGGGQLIRLILPEAVVLLNGKRVNTLEYITEWATEAMNQSTLTFPSGTLPDGMYQRECKSERSFAEGAFTINGTAIGTATMTVLFDIHLVRPAIKSDFEVNGRGRVISFVSHTVGGTTLETVQFILGPPKTATENNVSSEEN